MKSICLLLPVAAFLSACKTTPPVSVSPSGPDRFDLADTNKDGKLSPAELSTAVDTAQFSARDRNKDGSITSDECVAEEMKDFKASDTNGDGKVTFAEYAANARKSPARTAGFKEADTNHDGSLDRTETAAYYAARE